jgi:uncharacterized protein YneF (UPF0154 family)
MAQDHYIARTYLKHWTDTHSRKLLYAYRKSDLKEFRCKPADVCREWNGDLNEKYFKKNPPILGQLRKIFEKDWNKAIEQLTKKSVSPDDKFILAGYWAHLITCTPSWRATGVQMLEEQIKQLMHFMAKRKLRNVPFDASLISSLLNDGRVKTVADPDFIKAMVTKQLLHIAWVLYNQPWTVLENETDVPFVTSDNPCSIFPDAPLGQPTTRFLPVTPSLALFTSLDERNLPAKEINLKLPPSGSVSGKAITKANAKSLNRITVMNAEQLVFSQGTDGGIAD